jgi:hypothetical protein
MPVFFNGKRLISPQAASFIDISGMANANPILPAGTVAIMGANASANSGGAPQTPLVFTDSSEAQRVLVEGPLLEAVKRALSPGPTGGAGQVIALRANLATQSTGTLNDVAGSPAPAIGLVSNDYGQRTQTISVATSGPAIGGAGGKDILVTFGTQTVTGINVGAAALSIKYTAEVGSQGAPVAAVSYPGGAGQLVTSGMTTGANGVTLAFATYQTLQQLASALNATGNYTATVVHPNAFLGAVPSTVLDAQAAVAMSDTVAGTLTADVDAAVTWLNDNAGGILRATRTPNSGKLATQNVTLSGGVNGNVVPTTGDWQACLNALQNVDAHIIVPLTDNTVVHRLVQSHVQFMSDIAQGYGRRERIGVVGGAAGEAFDDITNAATRAIALQDSRMVVVGPGLRDLDEDGNVVIIPPFMLAAQIAGLIAGLPVGQSITRAYLSAVGVENVSATAGTMLSQTERDSWLLQGVCVLEMVPNRGVRVVQGRTSWSINDNFVLKEIVTRRCADWCARSVREACDNLLVGQPASPALGQRAVVLTSSILGDLATNGILVGDTSNPPFKNIVATIEGEVLRIDFQASPVIPANYVLITAHMVPFSGRFVQA